MDKTESPGKAVTAKESARELALLGRAYDSEVRSALTGWPHVFQLRDKLAEKLVADGLLAHCTITLGGNIPVTVKGYELTHAGRMLYCISGPGQDEETEQT